MMNLDENWDLDHERLKRIAEQAWIVDPARGRDMQTVWQLLRRDIPWLLSEVRRLSSEVKNVEQE